MSLEHAFFYKSLNGDRVYDDTSFEHWLKKFFTSGVFLNDLQVTANDDMTVTVGAGYVNADGKVKIFENTTSLIIETAGASYPRIDSIVLERNDTERDILLKVVKGGYSSEPVAHTPVRQDGVYQLVIAQVLVNAGAVKVTQANITDTRSNTELCGIVAGAVEQIDFSQVQAQFDSYFAQYKKQIAEDYAVYTDDMEDYLDQMANDFSAWFEHIKNQLDEDAAGHLQNQIDDINARLEYAGGSIVEVTVNDNEGQYNVEGLEVNLVIDGKTYTSTVSSEKVAKFTGVLEVGTAKITCIDDSQEFDAGTSVEIPYYGAYECSIKGGTSYKEWIEAGGVNPSQYETLNALLEDEKAVRALMTNKDAVEVLTRMKSDDLVTIINNRYAAKWINYREYAYSTLSDKANIKAIMDESGMYGIYITTKKPEALVPVLTSNNGSDGGTVIYSTQPSNFPAYKAFTRTNSGGSDSWVADNNCTYPQYLGYAFTKPNCVKEVLIANRTGDSAINAIETFTIQGSNYSDFSVIEFESEVLTHPSSAAGYENNYTINNYKSCLCWRINILTYNPEKMGSGKNVGIAKLQFYGYQEGDTLWEPKGLVPVMTSNTAPYGIASASHVEGTDTYAPWRAFDNDSSTRWTTTNIGASTETWFKYQFTQPTQVNAVSVAPYSDHNGTHLKDFVVQGSNDDSNWIDLCDTNTRENGDGSAITVALTKNLGFYIYYRLKILNSHTNYRALTSLQFYGRQLEALVPIMTSNIAPSGYEIKASSVYSSGGSFYAYKAFDMNFNETSCWHANGKTPQWLQIKLPVNKIVKHISITNRNKSSGVCAVKEFILQGSNDESKWDDIATLFNEKSGQAETSTYSIDNDEAYLYYRLYAESSYAENVVIGELQYFGIPDYDSRDYIYDNGVELMEIATSGTVSKNDNCITLSAKDSTATVNIDATNYRALCGVAGSNASGTNALICGSGSSTFATTNMLNNLLDVNSINGSNAAGIKQTAAGTFDCVALWLE